MQKLLFFAIISLSINMQLGAQYDSLVEIKDRKVKCYYSSGQGPKANSILERVEKAMTYYHSWAGFTPEVTLLVLTAGDWKKYTGPFVYGMPHYNNQQTLVVAAEDNPFWKGFIPPLETLPSELQQQIKTVYLNKDGDISLEPFFDLLAIHELGHAYHLQGGLNMQRKWLGELFTNILLHTYVAEKEPGLLPALTLFPKMVIGSGVGEFKFTSLKDIEENYEEIGKNHPRNYGWYQSRWHAAAGVIYDNSGKAACQKLWQTLKSQQEKLDDLSLQQLFDKNGLKPLADMMRNWDAETK